MRLVKEPSAPGSGHRRCCCTGRPVACAPQCGPGLVPQDLLLRGQEGSHWLTSPPHQALPLTPTCLSMPSPGSLGLVSCATHTKSPTCSFRTVWVTCSRCSWRISSDLCPALELQGRRLRAGQASANPSIRSFSSPHLTHPLVSPTSTHNSTLYSPGLSSSCGCWTLPSLAPLQGGGRGADVCEARTPLPGQFPSKPSGSGTATA